MASAHGIEPEQVERGEPVSASREAVPRLKKLLEVLSRGRKAKLVVGQTEAPVPDEVQILLRHVIEVLARGDAMSLVSIERELTTQQAADILNVSRQYMARLLDAGEVPCTKTKGAHRRVNLQDVLAYKRKRAGQRKAALDELVELTAEYGGYPELKPK